MLRQPIATDGATLADPHASSGRGVAIVLTPVSHPQLEDILIDEELFAVGRTEAPFAAYAPELVADLSRRHARIFCEYGCAYIVDLGSKNGTAVNGAELRQKIALLHDGDEICFGKALCYRVQLSTPALTRQRATRLARMTLVPDHAELGILPIVITQFPFLISKADATFARYKDQFPHQVNYISRRHAHIFLKGGEPFVEDLGSTNGTFVAGKRLDEHAVALKEGDVLAFGGHHFVYRVQLQQAQEIDPTVTKLTAAAQGGAAPAADAAHSAHAANAANAAAVDKTTFVDAATSFIDIFCVDLAQPPDDERNDEAAKQAGDSGPDAGLRRARGRVTTFAGELARAFAGARGGRRHLPRWLAAAAAIAVVAGSLAYFGGASQRQVEALLAGGDYPKAAAASGELVSREPGNAQWRALDTEAQLKAHLPGWLAQLKARQFDRANATLARLQQAGRRNADLLPLVGELEWMGAVEQFVAGRGGPDAPIRPYADEDRIKALLRRWEAGEQGHQRAFATISAQVPAFGDPYAEALSHLRKLQSDDAVYLPAIERLKAAIGTELRQDRPEALAMVLKEYAEKYPRLALDGVRADLQQYLALRAALRERRLGALDALLAKARFATPPFDAQFRTLRTGSEFPPPQLLQQYRAVAAAWQSGNIPQALAALQQIAGGAWADAVAAELARKKAIADQFALLQKSRAGDGYGARLLAFHGLLDLEQDAYFARSIEADLSGYRQQALAQAQQSLGRAQQQWQQYRSNGAIDGAQRLEAAVSEKFRAQAQRLAGAQHDARQGLRVYAQLKMPRPAQAGALHDAIDAEATQQRKALAEAGTILGPRLLKAKLALLAGDDDEKR